MEGMCARNRRFHIVGHKRYAIYPCSLKHRVFLLALICKPIAQRTSRSGLREGVTERAGGHQAFTTRLVPKPLTQSYITAGSHVIPQHKFGWIGLEIRLLTDPWYRVTTKVMLE
jgi:hypothetical protein